MEDLKTQSFASPFAPPADAGLGSYLERFNEALGFQSDADLARAMEVSPALIANWRRRGRIPAFHAEWFVNALKVDVLHRWERGLPKTGDLPVACALEAIRQAGGDPLDYGELASLGAAHLLGGLIAQARFLIAAGGVTFKPDEAVIACIAAQLVETFPRAQAVFRSRRL